VKLLSDVSDFALVGDCVKYVLNHDSDGCQFYADHETVVKERCEKEPKNGRLPRAGDPRHFKVI
jgi:hypothetical protein